MTTKRRVPSKKPAVNSCRPPKRGGCAPCDTNLPTTLQGLVDHYQKMQNDRTSANNPLKSQLDGYRELKEIKEAVTNAIQAKELVGKSYNLSGKRHGRRHGHQRRITPVAISSARKMLSHKKWGFKSFEDLYACILDACKDIRGIGPLYIYDAALRIGACLNLEPKQVYLHAGALAGAKLSG